VRLTGGAGLAAAEGRGERARGRLAAWAARGGERGRGREREGVWAGNDPTEGGFSFFYFQILISISYFLFLFLLSPFLLNK
jgi:hypothetical protein